MIFSIVQINDSHAYFDLHQEAFWSSNGFDYHKVGGYARIATILKQVRAASEGRTIFCDCGDTFHGTFPALKTEGQNMIPIMNKLQPDAMTAHWEFAYGPKGFDRILDNLDYPMLAINIYNKSSGALEYAPFIVKEVKGVRFGIVGVACNIVDKTMPPLFSEGLRFTLGRDELVRVISDLRNKEAVDFLILVSHLGLPQDIKLLSEVPGVDVCLSGHTHNRLYEPIRVGGALIIQSGSQASFLGLLDIDVEAGKLTGFKHRLIEISEEIPVDPEVNSLVIKATAPYCDELSEVVGSTAVSLNRSTVLASSMDDFLLEGLLFNAETDVAFSNGWRYGAPIKQGDVTLNDLYNMVPMDPPVSTVELSGQEIEAMLEENLEHTFAGDPYNQLGGYVKRCGGMTVFIKIENPEGSRIQRVFVGGKELAVDGKYTAVYITEQGVPKRYGTNRKDTGKTVVDQLRNYLSKQPFKGKHEPTFIVV